jgi:hypothetical protein
MSDKRKNYQIMSSIRYGVCGLILCLTVALTGNRAMATAVGDETQASTEVVSTEAASTEVDATEVTDQKTEKKTGKFITKNGKKYYQNENGKLIKGKFYKIKGKTYYFAKNGVMQKGWIKKGKDYYYLDRNTGVMKSGCKVDGIKIKKNGKAKKTAYNTKKIETMITAKKIVNKVTKTTDTKSQKLKKVFNWVLKHPYKRYRILAQAKQKEGWEMEYANDEFKKGKGCCVSEASALAFLAHECGYKDVYICDDTGHAWVEINGRVYDTLFAEAKNYNKYYNSSYKTAGLHRVGKKKI